MLTHVTASSFDATAIKNLNKVIKFVKKTAKIGLRMQRLDRKYLHLCLYSDASFANNAYLTSQLGYIVLLADKFNKCNILHFASYKIRRSKRYQTWDLFARNITPPTRSLKTNLALLFSIFLKRNTFTSMSLNGSF